MDVRLGLDLSYLPKTIGEMVAVDPDDTSSDDFTSRYKPFRMGNELPIGYGGCTLAVGLHAAAKTVPSTHKVHSVVGHFMCGTSSEQHLRCRVIRSRDTRVFVTRRVQILQTARRKSDGRVEERLCMELLADFHIEEPALMEFSAVPHRVALQKVAKTPDSRGYPYYTAPELCLSREQVLEASLRDGKIPNRGHLRQFASFFAIESRFFDMRLVPESLSPQNLSGLLRDEPTDQDRDHITERTSAEWYRVRPLPDGCGPSTTGDGNDDNDNGNDDERTQWATLALLMDSGLPNAPLAHGHRVFTDAGAVTSLDFALRFVRPGGLRLRDRWYLRERVTHAAAGARNYSEFRLWDQEGDMVAVMTQHSMMRPPPRQKGENKGVDSKAVL